MNKVFLVLACLAISALSDPGLTIGMNSKFIDKVRDAAYQHGMKKILNTPVQDIQNSNYKLKNIKVNGFKLDTSGIALDLNDGWIHMTIYPFAVNASMSAWNLSSNNPRWIDGKIQSSKSTVNIGIVPYFGNGTTSWTVHNISLSLQNIMILSDINKDQKFLGAFNSAFMKHLQNQIQETLNDISKQFPDKLNFLNRPLVFSAASVANPEIKSNYVSLFLDGAVDYKGKGTSDVPTPSSLPKFDSKNKNEFQAFVSDYVINTALVGMWENNYLDSVFKGSHLDTDSLNKAFPGLTSKYGNGKPVNLNCKSVGGNAPTLSIKGGKITGKISGSCVINVMKGQSYEAALEVKGTVDYQATPSIIDHSILQIKFVPKSINVISLSNSKLKQATTASSATTNLNSILSSLQIFRKFDLPRIPFITFKNSEAVVRNGYVEVSGSTKIKSFK